MDKEEYYARNDLGRSPLGDGAKAPRLGGMKGRGAWGDVLGSLATTLF